MSASEDTTALNGAHPTAQESKSSRTNGVNDTYKAPRNNHEYDRLRIQHDMIRTAMGGKLVMAPIHFQKLDLRILDSATADGRWLVELSEKLAPSTTLVGVDLAPKHFIENRPENVDLRTHSITSPWPEEYQSSFDLVNQRHVLAIFPEETCEAIVKSLVTCVKPGGWIQLHDSDTQAIRVGEKHPAMDRFRKLIDEAWGLMGYNSSPATKLAGWLKDAGVVDVEEMIVRYDCGPCAEDRVQGQRASFTLLAMLDNVAYIAQSGSMFLSSSPPCTFCSLS